MLSPSQYRRNAVFHVLDGIFFMTAMAVFSREVIIPAMVKELTESAFLLGLIPFIWGAGMILPQIFYAKRVEGMAYKKPTVLGWALMQRAGWALFLLSLLCWWGSLSTLVALYVGIAITALGTGMIMPVWTDWYAKTAPESMWAGVLGINWAVPGVLIAFFAGENRRIMDTMDSPRRYIVLLGIAMTLYVMSYISVLFVKEEPQHGQPHHRGTVWRDYLRKIAWITFRRRDFRRFMAASVLVVVPITVMCTFLTAHSLDIPGVQRADAGTFNSFYYGAMAAGAIFSGILSDRAGVMVPFKVLPVVLVAGCVTVFAIGDVGCGWTWLLERLGRTQASAFPMVFALLGFAYGMQAVANLPAVFRFAGPMRRPTYIAVSLTILGVANAVVPATVGILVDAGVLTFRWLFLGCGVVAACGWLVFLGTKKPQPAGADHP